MHTRAYSRKKNPTKLCLGRGSLGDGFQRDKAFSLILWANQDKNVLPCSGHHRSFHSTDRKPKTNL